MANHDGDHQPPPPASSSSSASPNARSQRNNHAKDTNGLIGADDDDPPNCSGHNITTTNAKSFPSRSSTTSSIDRDLRDLEEGNVTPDSDSNSKKSVHHVRVTVTENDGVLTPSSSTTTTQQDTSSKDVTTTAAAAAAAAGAAPAVPTTVTGGPRLLQPHTLTVNQVVRFFYPTAASTAATTTTNNNSTEDADIDIDRLPGLSDAQAATRLAECGPNEVSQQARVSGWSILLRQVANALTLVLVAAMALSFGVRDWVEGAVVTAVILLNVFLGWIQEWKAERTIASLRHLSSPTARVIRNGSAIEKQIPSAQLVPGDLVLFGTGDVLPADVRIVAQSNLEIDEASLTGESVPVAKTVEALDVHGAPVSASAAAAAKKSETLTAPLPPTTEKVAELGAGDQINMGFASTTVTKGRGKGIVVATGMDTQLGKIATAMRTDTSHRRAATSANSSLIRRRLRYRLAGAWEVCATFLGLRHGTPLQIRLNKFAYVLLGLAVVCAIVVFAVAEFDVTNEVILYAVALGIGVIPESLTAVLTITFSAGAKRMAESNVVVRKLAALESLGSVTDVFSDKTGTLTTSRMVTSQIGFVLPSTSNENDKSHIDQKVYGVERAATAYEPVGRLFPVEDEQAFIDVAQLPAHVKALTTAAALCNVAEISRSDSNNGETEWTAKGDPTEIALQVFAAKMQMQKKALMASGASAPFEFVQEFPFDSTIKRATFVYRKNDEHTFFTKGAVEGVLDRCTHIISRGEAGEQQQQQRMQLTDEHRTAILELMEKLASQGLRVLAFAHRHLDEGNASIELEKALATGELGRDEAEQSLTFLGLAGLYDPPRPETPGAVAACHTAGIVVRMLTGDHRLTAQAIAREIGILRGDEGASAVMTASQFDALTDEEIDALPDLPLVIARCSPTTKVRMVEAGHRRRILMAMTGDGVNDAPSLKKADCGIALGITGTQIAKDSSELILTDDKFNSIVKGIEEGRVVFDNIQKFCIALLVANVGEVILLLVGLAFRDAHEDSIFPLSPIAILFINMVTASLPAVGLGLERGGKDVMTRPPHDINAGVFSRNVLSDLFVYGITMGWTCLLAFIIMIYPVGGGVLAVDCNESLAAGCDNVFQARSAVFVALILENLLIAWELLDMNQSFFTVQPHKRLARNPMLFWSVIFGICVIPICLYVPRFNTDVFRHAPLSGVGWAVALGMTVVFILVVELWKALARRGYWPWLSRHTGGAIKRPKAVPAVQEKA